MAYLQDDHIHIIQSFRRCDRITEHKPDGEQEVRPFMLTQHRYLTLQKLQMLWS